MSESCQLFNGDSVELLKMLPAGSVDLVLTDPPYGISYKSQLDSQNRFEKILNDEKPFLDFIPELKRVLSPRGGVFVFSRWDVQQAFIDEMERCDLKVSNVLIWDKIQHSAGDLRRAFGFRYESILWSPSKEFSFKSSRPGDVIQFSKVAGIKLVHPNEKPVGLLRTLLDYTTEEGYTVLDCFMGSGSTGVAARSSGRKFIGMELDPHYFEVAKGRIEEVELLGGDNDKLF